MGKHYNKLALCLFFLINTSIAFSGNWPWAKGISSGTSDSQDLFSIATDPTGNTVVTGYANNVANPGTFTVGGFTITNNNGASQADVIVIKYDPTGTVLWATSAGGTGYDTGYSIATDAAGNIYVTGSYDSPTITFGGFTLTNAIAGIGGSSVFLVKYNPAGVVLWAKTSTGTNSSSNNHWDQGFGVATDALGAVYITGIYYSASIGFGALTLTNTNILVGFAAVPFFLVKYDAATGNEIWARTNTGGTAYDYGNDVATDPSGNIYVTGNFTSPSITFGGTTLTDASGNAPFLVKYDTNGNVVWALSPIGDCGTAWPGGGNGVGTDLSGNVFITGDFTSTSMVFGAYTLNKTAGFPNVPNYFVAKYNSSGTALWAKGTSAPGTADSKGYNVSTDPSGNAFVTGGYSGIWQASVTLGCFTFPYISAATTPDPMFIAKYDPNGNLLCADYLASGGEDYVDVAVDAAGSAFVCGDYKKVNPLVVGTTSLPRFTFENLFVAEWTCTSGVLQSSVSINNVLCFGQSTGSATASPVGGTSPFNYNWSNGTATATASGLIAGTYTVTISDAACATVSTVVTITQPPALTASASQTTPASCGNNNGSATAIGGGGTAPLAYNWTGGSTTATANNLAAGNYTVTVTDANGCIKTATVTISTSTGPAITSVTPTNPLCSSGTGSAVAAASGGSGILTYTWSTLATGQTVSGLASGTYSVTVKDGSGCTASSTVTITVPTAVTASASQTTPASCGNNNGSATATGGGGTAPLAYNWTGGSTTATANNLAAGNYTVTVTDANGCIKTAAVTINTTTGPAITSVNPTNPLCSSGTGSAVAAASGGSGTLTYNWSTLATGQTVSGLASGTYTVTVKDGSGCTASAAVTITVPQSLTGQFAKGTATCATCGCKEWIFATATGGTSPYTYNWTGGYDKRYKNHLCPGAYTVNIKDKNGCSVNVNLSAP